MANTLTSIDDAIIIQEAIGAFVATLAPLAAFSHNFSGDVERKGATVTVPLITKMTAGAFSNDYETGNSTAVGKIVTLNQSLFKAFHLSDTESGKTSCDVMAAFAREAAHSVAQACLVYAWGLIVLATYGDTAADKLVVAAGNWDADDMVDLADLCDDADWSDMLRAAILSNAYMTALRKDAAIQDASAYGNANPILNGAITRLSGFDVFRSNIIPGNSENLVGFAATPDGMAVACRPVAPQSEVPLDAYEVVTDPGTGLSLGYRRWYSSKTGIMWGAFHVLFGAKAVNPVGIKRILSA